MVMMRDGYGDQQVICICVHQTKEGKGKKKRRKKKGGGGFLGAERIESASKSNSTRILLSRTE